MLVRSLLDNIFLSTSLPIDIHKSCERNYKILDDLMDSKLKPSKPQEVEIEDMPTEEDDSTMGKAYKKRKQKPVTINIEEIKVK